MGGGWVAGWGCMQTDRVKKGRPLLCVYMGWGHCGMRAGVWAGRQNETVIARL